MKQFFCVLFLAVATFSAYAQSVTLKAGTIIPLRSIATVHAKDCEVGQQVKFRVTEDVKVNNTVAIPAGSIALGKVTLAQKSSLAGTKGRLNIAMDYLLLDNGEKIYLSGDVFVSGKNRTPLAVITGLFIWPCIFIPGTGAVMPEGYECTANTSATIDVK